MKNNSKDSVELESERETPIRETKIKMGTAG
jgi:hypothetical protein